MDDIGKALIMAAQVLMFAFAATVSIYLYSSLISQIDGIMLAHNYSNRGDAIVDKGDSALPGGGIADYRIVEQSEVVMTVLNLIEKVEKTGVSYTIKVNSNTFTSDGSTLYNNGMPISLNLLGKNRLLNSIPAGNYRLTYSDDGLVSTYQTI